VNDEGPELLDGVLVLSILNRWQREGFVWMET